MVNNNTIEKNELMPNKVNAAKELESLINNLNVEKINSNGGPKISISKGGLSIEIISGYSLTNQTGHVVNLHKKTILPKAAEFKNPRTIQIDKPPSLLKKSFIIKPNFQPIKNLFSKFAQKNNFFNENHRVRRLRISLNFFLLALILILPIKALFIYQNINQTKGRVLGATEEAINKWQNAIEAASENSWLDAGSNFNQAESYFTSANSNLNEINARFIELLKALPLGGKKISQASDFIRAGELVSAAAADFSVLMLNLKNPYFTEIPYTSAQVKNNVSYIAERLNQAMLILSGISKHALPTEAREQFMILHNNLPDLIRQLKNSQELFNFTFDLLGYNGPKRYIFVFQNNNELRPTGGFMGSFALVDVNQGKITNMEVPGGGFYDLKGDFFEKIIAPRPFHLLGTSWQIWNANWLPDFPTSAKKIIWFLEKSGWPTPDGLIAVNATVLPDILKLTGDISIPEYKQVFTPDNVIIALQHETEFEYDKAENQPKKVIGDLFNKVTEKLFKATPDQYLPLILSLNNCINNKDIQFFFQDKNLEQIAKNYGLTGEIINPEYGDYIRIDRTNIAGGKTDLIIKQEVRHYASVQADGAINDTVSITLTHQGDPNDVFERAQNNSYIRVYVPLNSELLAASGYDVIPKELFKKVDEGYMPDADLELLEKNISFSQENNTDIYESYNKTVFGNWIQLKPGDSKTLSFSYRLPFKIPVKQSWQKRLMNKLGFNINKENYLLTLQNQSGVKNSSFRSCLTLPVNMEIYWPDSHDNSIAQQINKDSACFEENNGKDRAFGLIMRIN